MSKKSCEDGKLALQLWGWAAGAAIAWGIVAGASWLEHRIYMKGYNKALGVAMDATVSSRDTFECRQVLIELRYPLDR